MDYNRIEGTRYLRISNVGDQGINRTPSHVCKISSLFQILKKVNATL